LNGYIPEGLLLVLFAGLMAFVAVRMWSKGAANARMNPPQQVQCIRANDVSPRRVAIVSRHTGVLAALGVATGVLSGLFGVGGGFVIVPALVLGGGMSMRRAVATSLVVITLVSAAGVMAYLVADRPLALSRVGLFVFGGIVGMWLGTQLGRKLSGPHLQQGFAVALILVAAFIITTSVL
jgi:uncharacterized membrane protein YfcA